MLFEAPLVAAAARKLTLYWLKGGRADRKDSLLGRLAGGLVPTLPAALLAAAKAAPRANAAAAAPVCVCVQSSDGSGALGAPLPLPPRETVARTAAAAARAAAVAAVKWGCAAGAGWLACRWLLHCARDQTAARASSGQAETTPSVSMAKASAAALAGAFFKQSRNTKK